MRKALLQIRKPALLLGAFVVSVFLPIHIVGATDDPLIAVASAVLTGTGGIIGVVVAPLALFILKIASLVNLLAGTFLNSVIKYTVVDMAANYSGIGAISATWTVMRDISNMAFIFVLLYASIQKILGNGDVNRLIVNMVIAALLINFSLFFTKIVIDASNLIALTFYQSLAPGAATGDALSAGLSNSLMQPLHLQSLWAADKIDLGDFKTLATIGVMGTLLILIATFIFVAVALLFIIRYVVLILVLIMSPIFFLANILPSMESYKKQWVSALTGQALFAPLYMLMTWITIKVFSSMPITSGDQLGKLSEAIAGTVTKTGTGASVQYQAGALNVFLNFAIVIAFLIISIVVAKSTSDSSGKGMSQITGKAFGFAGGATFGMAARLGRGTAGRFGAAIADNEKLKDMDAKGGIQGKFARLTLAAGNKSAGASFDVRGTGLNSSLNAGKAKKDGYRGDVKARVKAEEDHVKSLEPSAVNILNAELDVEQMKKKFGEGSEQHVKAKNYLLKLKGNSDVIKKEDEAIEERRKNDNKQVNTQYDAPIAEANKKQKTQESTLANLQKELQAATTDKQKSVVQAKIDIVNKELEEIKKEKTELEENKKKSLDEIKTRHDGAKATNKASEVENAGEVRKKAVIEGLTNPSLISTNRVFYGGAIDRSALQAAANIRKGNKSVRDTIADLLKEDEKPKPPADEGAGGDGESKPKTEKPTT